MKKKRTSRPYWEMASRELAATTAEFDREMVVDGFGLMIRESRARFERARKRGRPRPV